jgi:Na+:H+ antiporter, NhaA family
MALFIASLALSGPLMDSAKIGIFLASLFSAAAGLALLRWTQRPQQLDNPSQATEPR